MDKVLLMQLVRYLVERKGVTGATLCRVAKPEPIGEEPLDENSESPSSGQL